MLLCIDTELLLLRQPQHRPIPVVIIAVALLLEDLLKVIFDIRAISLAAP
jgi:hypothetical protein